MELQQLEYFITTAKYEHMTKAASALHIAQPALSQSIKRLEAELSVKLFDRAGRNITLSPAGKALQEEVIPILRAIDKLPQVASKAAGIADRTITVIVLSASELLTDLIIEYQALHPEAIFQIKQQESSQDWDIKIASTPSSSRDKSNHSILKEEIFMAVPSSSEYARQVSISLKQLRDEPFISLDSSRAFTKICDSYCESASFVPKIAYESDSPATVRKLIEAGLGVSFWPSYSWGPQNSPNVKLLPISSPKCTRQIYITKQNSSNTPIQLDFYNFLLEKFSSL